MQSSIDLPGEWSLDGRARHVSALPAGAIPSYTTADVRVATHLTPHLELAIVGQDLAHARHVEWPSGPGSNVRIQRSAYLKLT